MWDGLVVGGFALGIGMSKTTPSLHLKPIQITTAILIISLPLLAPRITARPLAPDFIGKPLPALGAHPM